MSTPGRGTGPFSAVLRGFGRLLARLLFRVQVRGLEHYAAAGERVLIVANHVSLLDGPLLWLFLPEAPAFAVNVETARRRSFRPLLALAECVEIDTLNPVTLKTITRRVREGRRAVIFPEGRISITGAPMKVYEGPGMIADKADAEILPVGIEGAQYSRLGPLKGKLRVRWLPRVTITILPPRRLDLPAGLQGGARRAAGADTLAAVLRELAFENAYRHETLFEALVRAKRLHGGRATVVSDATGAKLSYRQLLVRAFVLGALVARLTARGERVGIMLPSTVAAVVGVFACMARGREVAMLNFTAGARGLTTAVETAGIKLVFTSRAFVEAGGLDEEAAALDEAANLVYLEDLRSRIGLFTKLGGLAAGRAPRLAQRLLRGRADPDAPAVILFTSGSEGIPKGVVLSHANLLANYAQVHMLIDLTREDCVLNVLPIFHAFGLLGGVLLPMFKGCPSFQYPNPLHYRIVPELCYELGVSCLFGTTTFLRGYGRHAHPYDLRTLRFCIAGAEKLTDEVRELWSDKFGIRIFEGYGATEASPVVAVNNPLANRRGTVGQLLTGMDYYLEPVDGIAEGGELVVRGPNVMRGYLFHGSDGEIIPPWTERRGAGWYDTGDIVTVDAERYVTIQGRAKRFAKIGGEMVSLAAVEELAQALWPEALHAAIALPDARKGEQIALFTEVPDAERGDLVRAVREQSASELLIPRQVVCRENIPQLGSGKIDYLSLRAELARPPSKDVTSDDR